MGVIALTNPTLLINDVNIGIVPNNLSYTEGFGEQNMRVRSGGGGSIETVFSSNVETNLSTIKFQIYPTSDILNSPRAWKALRNDNVISISDVDFNRTFVFCALINDYEIPFGSDTVVELEWNGAPAI